MAYCTQSDVQIAAGGPDRLLQLADPSGSGVIDAAYVTRAIEQAAGWIDGFAQKLYDVPVNPVPPALRDVNADEAVFLLKSRRDMVNELDVKLHDARKELLEQFRDGHNTLGVTVRPTKSALVVDRQTERPSDKAVSREATKGYW